MYDELGASGLKLLESPAESNPVDILKNFQKNKHDRFTVMMIILAVFASILIEPILFSLKCDGKLGDNAYWVAIWTPVWIVDLVLMGASLMYLLSKDESSKDEHEEEEKDEKDSIGQKVFGFVTTWLFVLAQVFILIRMDHFTHWSWFVVFIPWFIHDGLWASNQILTSIEKIPSPDSSEASKMADQESGDVDESMKMAADLEIYYRKLSSQWRSRDMVVYMISRIWFAIFLALELDDTVNWNWGLVLLPIWVYLAFEIWFSYHLKSQSSEILVDIDEDSVMLGFETNPVVIVKFQHGKDLSSQSSFSCFMQIAPIFIAILLVCRLQVRYISTFIIILPVFIVLGCCCLGVFCGFVSLSNMDPDSFKNEGTGEYQPPNFPSGSSSSDSGAGSGAAAASSSTTSTQSPEVASTAKEGYGSFAPREIPQPTIHVAEIKADVDID